MMSMAEDLYETKLGFPVYNIPWRLLTLWQKTETQL